jgi:hypothetical protein
MKTIQKKNDKTTSDLPESKRDKELLKPDEATLDLPEVKDIPRAGACKAITSR